jgi:hypothetical protein
MTARLLLSAPILPSSSFASSADARTCARRRQLCTKSLPDWGALFTPCRRRSSKCMGVSAAIRSDCLTSLFG